MKKIKVLFLTGVSKIELINTIISENIEIAAIVVPKSRKYQEKYQNLVAHAVYNNIKVITAPIKELGQAIDDIEFNVLFSCGYPFKIPQSVIKTPNYAINFHPALLPKHRGRYVHWILIAQDKESGVTAHLMEPELDTGPIIDQEKFTVSPFDTVQSLLRKCEKVELILMEKIIKKIKENTIKAIPQNDNLATAHFKQRTPDDSEIDPSQPLNILYYEIRSCDPELYPAYFYVEGEKVGVKVFRLSKPDSDYDMI